MLPTRDKSSSVIFRFPTRSTCLYCVRMPFPDPLDRDEPAWKERAEAIEYWIMGALVAGAWVAGIVAGIRSLARTLGL